MSKTPPKTAAKTAKSPKNGAEIPLGAHPGNTGGKKGRSGRKPDSFKAFAVELARDPQFLAAVKVKALEGDVSAQKLVIQYAEGLPKQTVEHEGEVKHEHRGSLTWGNVEIPL